MDLVDIKVNVDAKALLDAVQAVDKLNAGVDKLNKIASSEKASAGLDGVAKSASSLKGVEANIGKLSDSMKIFRGEVLKVGEETVNLGASFTKSQANYLAYQKLIGATADQLRRVAKEFTDFNAITSANTFDNSIKGIERLKKDIAELGRVNDLSAKNLSLTRDQIMNLVRDTERASQAMLSMGHSQDQVTASLERQQQEYIALAKQKNELIAKTKALQLAAEQEAAAEIKRAQALEYVNKKPADLAFVNSQVKEGFTVASANQLLKYKEALDLTGMSADDARQKLAAFGEQLKIKQSASPFASMVKDVEETRKQVNHLARDVSVQLGDVAISLAGGQNPFMVMIQQGDQIRGALMRAKAQGVDTGNAMKNALGMIATSFVDLGKMVGSFFVGSIQSAGSAVKQLVTEKTMLGKAIDYTNEKFGTQSATIARLGAVFTAVAGTALVGFIASLGAMVVAYAQVVSEQDKLVKTINLVGGSLGLTADRVNMMAQTYAGATGTVTEFTNAIVEIAKTNAIPEDMIQRVSSVAIELKKVADIPVDKTIAEFAKLGEKPTESAIKLAEATGLIDAATLKSIASLERQGNVAEAAKLAIEGYAQGLSSATEIIRSEVSSWETISNSFFESFKRGWDTIKSLFRQAPLEMRMAEAKTLYEERLAAVDNPTGFKRLQTREARQEWADEAKERLDSIRNQLALERTLGDQRQYNSEQSEFVKNTEAAINATLSQRDKLLKQISIEQKKIEDGKIEEAAGLNLIKKLRKDIADIDEREAKKNKGPKPKESFTLLPDNTIEESKKQFQLQLQAVKNFENSQRDILKNAYEAGIVTKGEYLAKETQLTFVAFDKQKAIIEAYQADIENYDKRRNDIVAAYDRAVSKGGDKGELSKQLSANLQDLQRKTETAKEQIDSLTVSLNAATDKRFSDSWKEAAKSLMESKKAYEDFEVQVNQANLERKQEIELQTKLSGLYGAEAEMLKASTAAMKARSPAITKANQELEKATKAYEDFLAATDFSDSTSYERSAMQLNQLWANLSEQQKNRDKMVALARQDADQAATDAAILYQIGKYNELKATLADTIYTAIFEGGKKGGDILKNYLEKEFKNYVIKVFLEPIVGNMLGGAGSAGSSVAGSALSSAGSSLLGNSLTSSLGAVSAGLSSFGTALTASAQSMLGLTGTTSQMVTSLQAAGYWTGSTASTAATTAGANAGLSVAAAAPYVAAALVAANALGLFKKTEQKDVGVRGTFGVNTQVEGFKTFRTDGSLFSGPKWWDEVATADQGLVKVVTTAANSILETNKQYAKTLGLSADGIESVTSEFKISTKDLNPSQIQQKFEEALGAYNEAVSKQILSTSGVSEFSKLGESFSQTITRLSSSLTAVNSAFENLGFTLFETSLKGAQAASNYAESFGGVDNLANLFGSYYENFYSENEKAANVTKAITKELAKFGIEMPKTRKEFRDLVEANVKLGESGQPAVKALLEVSSAFAGIVPEASSLIDSQEAVKGFFAEMSTDVSKQLEDTLTAVMLGSKDGQLAGEELANAVVQGVQNAIVSGTTSVIAQSFTQSIIAPIIANVQAGRDAMQGVDLESAISTAGSQMKALQAVLTSPEVSNGFASITNALTGLVSTAEKSAVRLNSIGSSYAGSTYSGGYGGAQYDAPMPGAFGGTDTSKLVGAGQYAFTLPGYQEFQNWISEHVISSGGSTFAIGGSPVPDRRISQYISYVSTSLEGVNTAIEDAYKLVAENTKKLGKPKVTALQEIDSQYESLFDSLGGTRQQQHVNFFKTRIGELSAINAVIPGMITEITNLVGSVELKDSDFTKYYKDKATAKEKIKSLLSSVPTIATDLLKISNGTGIDDVIEGLFSSTTNIDGSTPLTEFINRIKTTVSQFADPFGEGKLEDSLTNATKELNDLKTKLDEWYLAQLRVLATNELVTLKDETQSTKDKTAELRRTGGVEDPITKLKEQFAQKIKDVDEGIGKILTQQINDLLGNKADTSKLDTKLAELTKKRATISAGGYVEGKIAELTGLAQSYSDAQLGASQIVGDAILTWSESVGTELESYNMGVLNNVTSTLLTVDTQASGIITEINRLKSGGNIEDIAALDKEIKDTEDKIREAVLAATDPKKRAELQAEIDKYKGGITEWFKAQAEYLSTEMLVDINKQIKELEATEKGQIQSIKDGIQKYIDDLKELGQYTPELQLAVDKLSNLQLSKARASAERLLMTPEQQKVFDTEKLAASFSKLGVEMPKTSEAFRALLSTVSGDAKDSLLDLVPAFMELFGSGGAVSSATSFLEAYKTELGRAPDTAGLKYWTDLVDSGTMTLEQAMKAFAEGAMSEKLNMRILELTDSEAYLAATRANELSLLSPVNQLLQKRIWLLEDEKKAYEDAQQATDKAIALVRELAQAQITELEKSFTATDKALALVQRSVDAQKKSIQTNLDSAKKTETSLTAIFDMLGKAVDGLLGNVKDQTGNLQYKQARQTIASALSTGNIPEQALIDSAVQSATSGLGDLVFATKQERDKAYLDLANELTALQKITKPQRDAATEQVSLLEDQLKKLDDQLKEAQDLVDKVRDVDNSVTDVETAVSKLKEAVATETSARDQIAEIKKTVETAEKQYAELRNLNSGINTLGLAINNLATAILAEKAAAIKPVTITSSETGAYSQSSTWQTVNTNKDGTTYGTGGGSVISDKPTSVSLPAEYQRQVDISKLYVDILGRGADVPGLNWYVESDKSLEQIAADLAYAKSQGSYYTGGYTGDGERTAVAGIVHAGEVVWNQSDVDRWGGWQAVDAMRQQSPEDVKPAGFSSFASNSSSDATDAALIAELQAVREELAMLRAETRAGVTWNSKSYKLFDRAVRGEEPIKTTVVP